MSWCNARLYGENELFSSLLQHVRFPHVTLDYLSNVIAFCPYMQKSGMLLTKMAEALMHRRISPAIRAKHAEQLPTIIMDRAEGKMRQWKVKVELDLSDFLTLQSGERFHKVCGLVSGYPLYLAIIRKEVDGDVKDNISCFWFLKMPSSSDEAAEGAFRRVPLTISWKMTGGVGFFVNHFFNDSKGWGHEDIYGKPWEEVINEGSPYFPQGKSTIEATIKDFVYASEKQEPIFDLFRSG